MSTTLPIGFCLSTSFLRSAQQVHRPAKQLQSGLITYKKRYRHISMSIPSGIIISSSDCIIDLIETLSAEKFF